MRDYFAAGRRRGFLSVAFSARATGESAWLLLGLTGMAPHSAPRRSGSCWARSPWSRTTVQSIVSLALIGLGFMGSPQIFVRRIALKDEGEIRKGASVAILFTRLSDTGAVMIGMVRRALLTEPGQEFEAVLGQGAAGVLPQLVDRARRLDRDAVGLRVRAVPKVRRAADPRHRDLRRAARRAAARLRPPSAGTGIASNDGSVRPR